jgi:hypothetical protein
LGVKYLFHRRNKKILFSMCVYCIEMIAKNATQEQIYKLRIFAFIKASFP